MHQVLAECPVCNQHLSVQKLKCQHCKTTIENEFSLSKFDYLTKEQLFFVETFMKCRGSIKEVEKELGISYPTVRAKLDEVVTALGYAPTVPKTQKNSNAILEALEKGEISPEEAIDQLK